MICQIDSNCTPFQSLNTLPFHIRLECLKLIYYSLKSIFFIYYFKTGTCYLFFLSSPVFIVLEFDSNYFDVLLWKIVKPQDQTINWKNIPKIQTNQTLFCNFLKIIAMVICKQKLWQIFINVNKKCFNLETTFQISRRK